MRRRDPDELTDREREVLELLRRDFTNEQIAQRLGISLDGAKYHVSEILSKLSVSTREEAAILRLEDRRPWWMTGFAIAGAGAAAATVGAVALLVTGALRTDEEARVDPGLTLEQAYDRISDAIARPGYVLHTTIVSESRDADVERLAAYTKEIWTDSSSQRIREEIQYNSEFVLGSPTTSIAAIFAEDYVYLPDSGTDGLTLDTYEESCPDNESMPLARVLECGVISPHWFNAGTEWRVEVGAEYEGRAAIALVSETYHEQPAGNFTPGAPIDPSTKMTRLETAVRLYIDPDTFLPIAQLSQYVLDGEYVTGFASRYQHEFIAAVDLPADLFDPRSIGYEAADVRARLDEITREVPVYWLGDALSADSIPGGLVLGRVIDGADGSSGELAYRAPTAGQGMSVRLWQPLAWEDYLETWLVQLPVNGRCLEPSEISVDEMRAVIFMIPPIGNPPSDKSHCPSDWREWTDEPGEVFAYVEFDGVVVQLMLGFIEEDESANRVRALVEHLRLR